MDNKVWCDKMSPSPSSKNDMSQAMQHFSNVTFRHRRVSTAYVSLCGIGSENTPTLVDHEVFNSQLSAPKRVPESPKNFVRPISMSILLMPLWCSIERAWVSGILLHRE